MAKYLRPRRGSKANAQAQKIKLQKGEMFMEFPNGYIGKEPGRIVIGDGATSYNSLDYATSATNVFQPFITDPSIYIPRFANTATSTGSGAVNSAMTSIEKMGNGSTASTVTLPTIVSAVKEALVYHANSITKLNNDLAGKASTSHNHDTSYLKLSSTGAFSTTAHNHQSSYTYHQVFTTTEDQSDTKYYPVGLFTAQASTVTGNHIMKTSNWMYFEPSAHRLWTGGSDGNHYAYMSGKHGIVVQPNDSDRGVIVYSSNGSSYSNISGDNIFINTQYGYTKQSDLQSAFKGIIHYTEANSFSNGVCNFSAASPCRILAVAAELYHHSFSWIRKDSTYKNYEIKMLDAPTYSGTAVTIIVAWAYTTVS